MPEFAPPGNLFTEAARDAWYPRVRVGYFYANDRKYYLYARKRTRTLRETTCLVYELADVPITGTVSVEVEGVPYHNWVLEGDKLFLKLDDEESFHALWSQLEFDLNQWGFIEHGFGFGPSNQVKVSYQTMEWVDVLTAPEPTGNRYQQVPITEVFLIKEADRVDYRLTKPGTICVPTGIGDNDPLPVPSGFVPDPPLDCAPVVITDDALEYHNPIDYQIEFAVDPLTGELIFNAPRNLIQNPSFEISATGVQYSDPTYPYPSEWRVPVPTAFPDIEGDAYHGNHCRGILSTGLAEQTVRIDARQNYVASVMVKGGVAKLCINFLDFDRIYIDTTGGISPTGQPSIDLCTYVGQTGGDDWTRLELAFGQASGGCDDPAEVFPIPSAAEFMELRLQRVSGAPCVDAVQIHEGLRAAQFFGFDPNITIETESSEDGFFMPELGQVLLTQLNDTNMNPLSVVQPGGFLFIEEFSNVEDFQLGKGQIQTLQVVSPTGVVEVTGVVDVAIGRQFLPYAKASGWNKLRQRATFHLENPSALHDVTDLNVENGNPKPLPASIEFVISEGLELENGQPVLVVVPDSRIPVRLDAYLYDHWENPAFVYTGLASSLSGVIDPTDGQSSSSGQIPLTYTPPDHTGVGDFGHIDTITLSAGQISRQLRVKGYRADGLDYEKFLGVS